MTRAPLPIAAAAFLLLCAAATSRGAGDEARGGGAPALRDLIRAGESAPAFALDDLDGRNVPFDPARGRPTLLLFFSAFCPLCRDLAPSVALAASRAEGKARVVGVNLDGKRFAAPVRSFVAAHGFRFPVLLDEIRDDLFLASDRYGVSKTPTAVLIDGRGVVRGSFAAEKVRDALREFDRLTAGARD